MDGYVAYAQSMPHSATIDPVLVEKAAQWRNVNIILVMLPWR
jgi:hypothetical protein